MKLFAAYSLLVIASATTVLAGNNAPEIGASTAAGALTLVGGAMLILRSRRK